MKYFKVRVFVLTERMPNHEVKPYTTEEASSAGVRGVGAVEGAGGRVAVVGRGGRVGPWGGERPHGRGTAGAHI